MLAGGKRLFCCLLVAVLCVWIVCLLVSVCISVWLRLFISIDLYLFHQSPHAAILHSFFCPFISPLLHSPLRHTISYALPTSCFCILRYIALYVWSCVSMWVCRETEWDLLIGTRVYSVFLCHKTLSTAVLNTATHCSYCCSVEGTPNHVTGCTKMFSEQMFRT